MKESVTHSHGKRYGTVFPSKLDKEELIEWLDSNGFKSLGVWSDINSSALSNSKGLRYQIGPWKTELQKWIFVKGNGRTSVRICFGNVFPFKYHYSEVYVSTQSHSNRVSFDELEDVLKKIIEESK